jgi:RNA polymerase sigma-70 factor (ECF subfamily)
VPKWPGFQTKNGNAENCPTASDDWKEPNPIAMRKTLDPLQVSELIDAAQHGDNSAFDRLVREYQDYLYRLMVRACHHPDDAEEVASEAFVRAYERLCQFEGRSSFVTWLGRIATNLCFRRREKSELPPESLEERAREEEGHPDRTPAFSGPTPEQRAIQEEMKRTIRSAIAELPEPEQTVFRFRDIDQLSALETAARTGLTVAAVKARLHRARARLRKQLNHYFLADY